MFFEFICAKHFHGLCLLGVIFRENIDLSSFSVPLGCKIVYLRHVNQDITKYQVSYIIWGGSFVTCHIVYLLHISEILCAILER